MTMINGGGGGGYSAHNIRNDDIREKTVVDVAVDYHHHHHEDDYSILDVIGCNVTTQDEEKMQYHYHRFEVIHMPVLDIAMDLRVVSLM